MQLIIFSWKDGTKKAFRLKAQKPQNLNSEEWTGELMEIAHSLINQGAFPGKKLQDLSSVNIIDTN